MSKVDAPPVHEVTSQPEIKQRLLMRWWRNWRLSTLRLVLYALVGIVLMRAVVAALRAEGLSHNASLWVGMFLTFLAAIILNQLEHLIDHRVDVQKDDVPSSVEP